MWINSPLAPNFEIDLKAVFEKMENNRKKENERIATVTYPNLCNYFHLPLKFTEKELYQAYRKLLVKYHPDKNDGNIEMFDEVKQKYNELTSIMQREDLKEFGIAYVD